MTDKILIKPSVTDGRGWSFFVTFAGGQYSVVCSRIFWNKITHGDISPMDLVRLGLLLAIRHRVTSSLPPEFRLEQLDARIPDFEKNLRLAAQIEASANPR